MLCVGCDVCAVLYAVLGLCCAVWYDVMCANAALQGVQEDHDAPRARNVLLRLRDQDGQVRVGECLHRCNAAGHSPLRTRVPVVHVFYIRMVKSLKTEKNHRNLAKPPLKCFIFWRQCLFVLTC